jgi:hypothetical protein
VERVSLLATATKEEEQNHVDRGWFLPIEHSGLGDLQTAIPKVAQDPSLLKLIPQAAERIPTRHLRVFGTAQLVLRNSVDETGS